MYEIHLIIIFFKADKILYFLVTDGFITFQRQVFTKDAVKILSKSVKPIKKIKISEHGRIEDSKDSLQVSVYFLSQ